MSQTLRNIQKSRQGVQSNVVPFPAMLEQFKGEIARALPKHLSPDRMVRIALTAFRMNPKLAQTDPRSVFAAVIQSSQLGLEVGLMGEAHLVPFGNQCQLIPGYQGLMKLARNSGLVQDIYGHEVRINDKFDIVLGLNRTLMHEPLKKNGFPASDEERGVIVGFYAVAVFKDGTRTFHAMSKEQIEQVRDNSRGYQMAKKYGKESPWDTHFVPMGLKTVIRRLCNLLPKSPELAMALALGVLGHLKTPFTLFNMMGLMLVLGVGVNYAIFLREGGVRAAATLAGVLLSAGTTLLSFGLLAFSSMPALAGFGLTLLVGVGMAVLLAPMVLTFSAAQTACPGDAC